MTKATALKLNRQLWGHAAKPFKVDDEWYTPHRYVEAVRSVLGEIDLDPASNESAQRAVRAARWYGKAEDGLLTRGSVACGSTLLTRRSCSPSSSRS